MYLNGWWTSCLSLTLFDGWSVFDIWPTYTSDRMPPLLLSQDRLDVKITPVTAYPVKTAASVSVCVWETGALWQTREGTDKQRNWSLTTDGVISTTTQPQPPSADKTLPAHAPSHPYEPLLISCHLPFHYQWDWRSKIRPAPVWQASTWFCLEWCYFLFFNFFILIFHLNQNLALHLAAYEFWGTDITLNMAIGSSIQIKTCFVFSSLLFVSCI